MQDPRLDAESEKIIAIMNIIRKLYTVKFTKHDNCYCGYLREYLHS